MSSEKRSGRAVFCRIDDDLHSQMEDACRVLGVKKKDYVEAALQAKLKRDRRKIGRAMSEEVQRLEARRQRMSNVSPA